MKYKKCLFLIFFILTQSNLKALDFQGIVHSRTDFSYPNKASFFYVDEERTLQLSDIRTPEYQAQFKSLDIQKHHLGLIRSNLWVSFQLENQSGEELFLELDNSVLDTVQYFLVDNDGQLVHHTTFGNFTKFKERPVRSNRLMIEMKLQGTRKFKCYLKVNSASSTLTLPMRIGTLKQFYEYGRIDSIWQGIYFGLIIFISIYNLFLFVSIKDPNYILFALYIACMGMLFALYKGFGVYFLGNDPLSVNEVVPLVSSVAGIFAILFSARFLDSNSKTTHLHFLLNVLIGFYLLISLVNFTGFRFASTVLLKYTSAASLLLLMTLGIKSWKEGFKPAKYYLVAWSFFVGGFIIYMLRESFLIETTQFTGNILQISSTATIICMSFALSKKINIYIENSNEARDLALRTALENEQLTSNQKQVLEAKVNQRTIDLEQTISTLKLQRQDLHEVNNFKDKVFSIISHDLKSPISTLAGLLKLIKGKSINENERAKIVENLELALKNTKILLDNILAWAHTSKKSSEELDSIEIHSTIENVFDLFRFQAEIKNISLNNDIERGFFIEANENMLLLVLRNLISNAIKFTPKGGSVRVDLQQDFLDVAIRVIDTGIGIPKKLQSNLFKIDKHTTTRGTENEKGTGLGLMLCKEFLDKYDGRLRIESEEGKGTTICVILKKAIPVVETVST